MADTKSISTASVLHAPGVIHPDFAELIKAARAKSSTQVGYLRALLESLDSADPMHRFLGALLLFALEEAGYGQQ